MKIITVVSDLNSLGFTLLRLSCAVNDLNFVALGCRDDEFTGNRIKDSVLKEYLNELSNDEIILFTDGYDSLLLAQEDEILHKFYQTKAELLFSTETNCWPDTRLSEKYPETNSPYKYLNSGGFIGRVGVIKEMLSEKLTRYEDNFKFSNQYLWTIRYFQNTRLINLDTDCNIFCTFSPEIGENLLKENDDESYRIYSEGKRQWFKFNFVVKNNRIFNKISGTWPCNVHFNGKSKCLIDATMIDMVFTRIPGNKKFSFQSNAEMAGLLP